MKLMNICAGLVLSTAFLMTYSVQGINIIDVRSGIVYPITCKSKTTGKVTTASYYTGTPERTPEIICKVLGDDMVPGGDDMVRGSLVEIKGKLN